MKSRHAVLLLTFAVATFILPARAFAQYFFLDVDGDAQNLPYHEWAPTGSDTINVDLYVVTDKNLDGSPAACDTDGQPIEISGYTVTLVDNYGPMHVVDIENLIPGMSPAFQPIVSSYGLSFGYAGGTPLPAGKHHLARLRAITSSLLLGQPCWLPEGPGCSVVSGCAGADDDYTMPVGGVGFGYFTDPPNLRPIVTSPHHVTATEGEPISFSVSVEDGECGSYPFGFSVYPLPAGASFSGLGAFGPEGATGTFNWTPSIGQAGEYMVKFEANDPDYFHWWFDPVSDTTHISVIPTLSSNTAPTARSGGPYFAAVNESVTLDGSGSSDLEGALSYVWTLGDGADAEGKVVSHAFGREGTYEIGLLVTDVDGATAYDRTVATVGRPGLALSIAPNPVTTYSAIAFTTTKAGRMTARLFDTRGRLVDESSRFLSAGHHRIPMPATLSGGRALASGVYFLQVSTERDGHETRRVTVLRQ